MPRLLGRCHILPTLFCFFQLLAPTVNDHQHHMLSPVWPALPAQHSTAQHHACVHTCIPPSQPPYSNCHHQFTDSSSASLFPISDPYARLFFFRHLAVSLSSQPLQQPASVIGKFLVPTTPQGTRVNLISASTSKSMSQTDC
jgi:hypothetical protein